MLDTNLIGVRTLRPTELLPAAAENIANLPPHEGKEKLVLSLGARERSLKSPA